VVRTFYEFFAGGGMARVGLGSTWRCVFANDIDPLKAKVYADNHGNSPMWLGDVANISTSKLPGRADLAWASFPCQDVSLAGAGAGLAGARSGTFVPFWQLMLQLRRELRAPRVCVIENVCGLLTSHHGKDFADVCRMLQLGGYRFGALVIDAAHFVPQSRPRLFIVAVDRDVDTAEIVADGPHAVWHTTRLRAAYAALAPDLQADWLWFAPARPLLCDMQLRDIIEHGTHNWHSPESTARLLGMMTPLNRAKVDEVAAGAGHAIGAIYRRTRPNNGGRQQRAEVRFDGLAGCLRTPGGGSSRQTILVIEDGAIRSRLLSARETARLMGLPDSYHLPNNYNQAYHVTGDGVVVPVVRWLASQILEPLLAASPPRVLSMAA